MKEQKEHLHLKKNKRKNKKKKRQKLQLKKKLKLLKLKKIQQKTKFKMLKVNQKLKQLKKNRLMIIKNLKNSTLIIGAIFLIYFNKLNIIILRANFDYDILKMIKKVEYSLMKKIIKYLFIFCVLISGVFVRNLAVSNEIVASAAGKQNNCNH